MAFFSATNPMVDIISLKELLSSIPSETNEKNQSEINKLDTAANKISQAASNHFFQHGSSNEILKICVHHINKAKELFGPTDNWTYFRDLAVSGLTHVQASYENEKYLKEYVQFLLAIRENKIEEVEAFIKQGLDPNLAITEWKESGDPVHSKSVQITALGLACIQGSEKMVELLISRGADPNFAIMSGYSTQKDAPQSLNDFTSPEVIPAWMALLNCKIASHVKRSIWKKFKGKANLLMKEGCKWWLTRSFFETSMKPEDLNTALTSTKSKLIKASENFMEKTFYDIPNKLAVLKREFGASLLSPEKQAEFHEHTIKLGAVAISHGMSIPTFISDATKLLETYPDNEIYQWVGHKTKDGIELSMVEQIRQEKEAFLKEKLGCIPLEDSLKADAELASVKAAVRPLLKDINPLANIVADYFALSPEQYNTWIAESTLSAIYNK